MDALTFYFNMPAHISALSYFKHKLYDTQSAFTVNEENREWQTNTQYVKKLTKLILQLHTQVLFYNFCSNQTYVLID